jgi:hypothetical protein
MKQVFLKLMPMGLLLLLFYISGCARPLPPELSLPSRSESQLLAHLDVVTSRYQSLQSSAKIEVVTAKETFAASQVLFVQRPAQLRSEILFGPFATPVMSLSADQDQLSVYQPLQGTLAQGSASVANIARYTRLPLRVEDLVGMILVAPPRFPFEHSSTSRVAAGDRLDLVAVGGVEQRFTFDAAGNLLQAAYILGERLQLQADYSGFDAQSGDFPKKLQVSMPERQVVATMTFSDSVINVPIPPHNFVLKIPAGTKLQSLP